MHYNPVISKIKSMQLYNINGRLLAQQNNPVHSLKLGFNPTPGIYVAILTLESGKMFHEKIFIPE